jgi:adenine-specific DNA-methyltransferase
MNIKTPIDALKSTFWKEIPTRAEIDLFKKNLILLLDQTKIDNKIIEETEEHLKNDLMRFLTETFYKDNHYINTKDRKDFVIHNGNTKNSKVGVIIETKVPNSSDMITKANFNTKSLCQLLLYYLRERFTIQNLEIKHLIITDIFNWFIFDAKMFEKIISDDKHIVTDFKKFEQKELVSNKVDVFYKDIAKPFFNRVSDKLQCTYFNIQDYENQLRNEDKKDDIDLIELFNILSPKHLLNLPFANDSNTLNTKFYSELLHIIGLTETKIDGKKLIQRLNEDKRNSGSILEYTIIKLSNPQKLKRLESFHHLGKTKDEILFNAALELSITWINRILFLKLLEAQLLTFHDGDKEYSFLNINKINSFDKLESLFFEVLAIKPEERNDEVKKSFRFVPYLNSSLFEETKLEEILSINQLENSITLPIISTTVLIKDTKKLNTLEYLFEFLNAYDFSSSAKDIIKEEQKTIINASVLGLIFEKINGYKDGSFFTPGFITMYMCRETIERAIVQKFSEGLEFSFANIDEVENYLSRNNIDLQKANEIFNSITICDPAVGSGHFLVSSLNELIALKYRLNILTDRKGIHISKREYKIEVENDELIVRDSKRKMFHYNKGNEESQRIQETMFHEKQTLIERCLFGVDINENSVKICRLRLWIELLKYAYYRTDGTGLETLPNIDINIKCGNSLVSRFHIKEDLKSILNKKGINIETYRVNVDSYRNAKSKEDKWQMESLIAKVKEDFTVEISNRNEVKIELNKIEGLIYNHTNQGNIFQMSKEQTDDWNYKLETLTTKSIELQNKLNEIENNPIYRNAFEWRFEFPEVLDDDGNFIGFDIIIGNPPYIQLQNENGALRKLYEPLGYETFASMGDIYSLFMEKGFTLVKSNGVVCMIVSNKWMRVNYGEKLRMFLAKKQGIRLIDLGPGIFDSATVDTCIYIGTNEMQQRAFSALVVNKDEDIASTLEKRALQFSASPNGEKWIILSPMDLQIKNKIDTYGTPLKNWDINIYRGLLTGYNEAFIIDGTTKDRLIAEDPKNAEIIKPILRGRDIKRYKAEFADLWLINTHNGVKSNNISRIDVTKDYPTIYKHLLQYEKELIKRLDKGDHWTNLRNCAYLEEFEKDIIVWKAVGKNLTFGIWGRGKLLTAPASFLSVKEISIKYLLGFLQSKFSLFFIINNSDKTGAGDVMLNIQSIENLPIPQISEEEQKPFEELVDIILTKKERGENTSAEERRIDEMVYTLYHLTPDEIKHIEGKE